MLPPSSLLSPVSPQFDGTSERFETHTNIPIFLTDTFLLPWLIKTFQLLFILDCSPHSFTRASQAGRAHEVHRVEPPHVPESVGGRSECEVAVVARVAAGFRFGARSGARGIRICRSRRGQSQTEIQVRLSVSGVGILGLLKSARAARIPDLGAGEERYRIHPDSKRPSQTQLGRPPIKLGSFRAGFSQKVRPRRDRLLNLRIVIRVIEALLMLASCCFSKVGFNMPVAAKISAFLRHSSDRPSRAYRNNERIHPHASVECNSFESCE